ncbi:uncharacterized protein LOC584907 isoform X2 [Strongylocentrotus purpuratus]|uniref:EGF-like domain-containing protein n=1 Tax=Strongylocentrotus purpuratus TaxID=7668 RepID=A0A7M7MYV3_STRPU|nr:uncharacterized protein LOC584907 isoform X2 [Strongylocentrotus purpuratus]
MMSGVGYETRWRLFSLALVLHIHLHSLCVSASSYRLNPDGRNVCSTTRRNSHLVIGKQYARLINQTVYHCCEGWRSNGRDCPIAVCSQGCQRGNCTAPGMCSCEPGFMGIRCELSCPRGRYGPFCEQQCNCGQRECDPVMGRCTPACPSGHMGPNCVMPCPPGRFGPDCVDFCQCPFSVIGEILCDSMTGNCTEPTLPPTTRKVYDSTMLESTDTFHEFFQYDTESPSIINPKRKNSLRVRAMRLGISGAVSVLLMIISLILALYVYRKFRNRPCICLQRKKIRTAMLKQQRERDEGRGDHSNHVAPTPRAHFPNPHLPHALPYRLPSLCNYTGLRQTGNLPGSVLFDPLPGVTESSTNVTSVDVVPVTMHQMPEETIYEVRPSLVAKSRRNQDMTSGYIENDTLSSMSRVVQGCEIEIDSATSSAMYHRDLDDEEPYDEEYDYPYADNAKIQMGLDRFQTKRSRPGAHEHDNSIYAVVLENEKPMNSQHDGEYERENHRSRESDILADAGNHGRTHTDPFPLPSHLANPPSDGTYTALIAGTRSPWTESSFPERTPGSGCSTAPATIALARKPSMGVAPSVRPRASPVVKPIGNATSIRPRGMSEIPRNSYATENKFVSSRPKKIISQVDSNGYTTAIRAFSSMRQPRRPATKRKSRPSIELRQTPSPMIPPRLSESDIPPLSPDPTADHSMKTQLLQAVSSNPRYVNGCIISPKQKPKERTRSRTPAMIRRAKNVLPLPTTKVDEESEKLYDDILPFGD